jgi:hypothetical protein
MLLSLLTRKIKQRGFRGSYTGQLSSYNLPVYLCNYEALAAGDFMIVASRYFVIFEDTVNTLYNDSSYNDIRLITIRYIYKPDLLCKITIFSVFRYHKIDDRTHRQIVISKFSPFELTYLKPLISLITLNYNRKSYFFINFYTSSSSLLRIRAPTALACGLGTGLAHPRLVFLYLEALLGPFFSLDLLSSFSYTLMIRS